MRRVDLFLISCLIVGASVSASAGTGFPGEQRTSRYLDSVRQEPLLLLAFLREIPKGGDLHNHLAGAIYAETLIDFAAKAGLCVDRKTSALLPPPCDDSTGKPPANSALRDPALYNQMIDAFSMRNWNAARLATGQSVQVREEPLDLVLDRPVPLVRRDHILGLAPQRVHRVQLRGPLR